LFALTFLFLQPRTVEALTFDNVPYIETREQYQRRILEQYDWNADIAYKVMMAESGGNTKAFNPEWHSKCQGSYGAMQLSCLHYIENPSALFDFEFNVQKAYELYKRNGFSPWSVCTNGKVDCTIVP